MILVFGSNLDCSTNNVTRWLNKLQQKIILYSGVKDYKLKSLNRINTTQVKSIWYRKYETDVPDIDQYDKQVRVALFNEYRLYLDYISNKLSGIKSLGKNFRSMDPDKLFVSQEAQKAGLRIPDFIITTCKKELIEFYKKYNSIITKPICNGSEVKLGKQWIGIMYTALITDEILQEIPESFFPSLFQQYIKKEIELRIFYLEGRFYSSASYNLRGEEAIDSRNTLPASIKRQIPFKLPTAIEEKITNLMNKIGLNTGSIDMIKTVGSEYYFLEVNPVGQYDEVSINCNYYIDKTIAYWLAGK